MQLVEQNTGACCRLARLEAHFVTTAATESTIAQLRAKHALPGTPPRERKVPIQHHAQDEVALKTSTATVAIPDITVLETQARRAIDLTPAWTPHTAAEMGGDYPYGRRPATGFTLTDAQIAHFCSEGYVILRGVYSALEAATLRGRASNALAKLRTQADGATNGVNFSFAPGPEQGASAPHDVLDRLNPHRVAQVDDFHKMDREIEGHMRCPR